MEQERILHFRDTFLYARFKLYEAQEPHDDNLLFDYLKETSEWVKVTVGTEDRRYMDISKELKALDPEHTTMR
jgi:hypothetical protein